MDRRVSSGLARASGMYILWLYLNRPQGATVAQSILKWGNSLAFRIPSAIAKQMQIEEGAEVQFRIEGKQLIVEKADEMPRFTDRDLIRALRKAKKELIDLGRP